MNLPDERGGSWTLLTGHGHVLVEIARNPKARIRDIAAAADITERTAQAIVADLEAAGYITRTRTGRRTRYSVNPDSSFRHPAQEGLRSARSWPCSPLLGTAPLLAGCPGDQTRMSDWVIPPAAHSWTLTDCAGSSAAVRHTTMGRNLASGRRGRVQHESAATAAVPANGAPTHVDLLTCLSDPQ
jgi:MarR family